MAFRMNRPVIKGTSLHKASVAKARKEAKSIVADTRTKADRALVTAASALGESYIPGEIDYTKEFPDIQIPDKKKKKKKKQTLDERLAEAEKLADWEKDEDIDFSAFGDGDKSKKTKKKGSDKYRTMPLGPEHEEYAKKLKADSEARLKARRIAAAKKYNVSVEDLELKEIKGGRGYFPKEGTVGGPHTGKKGTDKGTQWSDELGRFKIPEAKILTPKETEKMLEEMKPKFPSDVSKTSLNEMIQSGELALDYEDNTYKYTTQYYDRIAREKIAKKDTSTKTSKKSTRTSTNIKPKQEDYKWGKSGGWKYKGKEQYKIDMQKWKESRSPADMRDDRIYRNAIKGGTVRKNMINSGYIPPNE